MVGEGEEREEEWREGGGSFPVLSIFRDYHGDQLNWERFLKTKQNKSLTNPSGVVISGQVLLIPYHIFHSVGTYWTHHFDSWSVQIVEILPKFTVSSRKSIASELINVLIWKPKWGLGRVDLLWHTANSSWLRVVGRNSPGYLDQHFCGNRKTFLQECSWQNQDQVNSFPSK